MLNRINGLRCFGPPKTADYDVCLQTWVKHRLQLFLQLARLIHFSHDVAAADELTLNVQLRYRRPIGVVLDALTYLRIGKDIDSDKVIILNIEIFFIFNSPLL